MRRTKIIGFAMLAAIPLLAQAPPSFPPQQLDNLVSRVALYPDPLLAQVLAAATYSDQIPDAAQWSDEHHYVTGDALARDIQEDQLPWDPSVQALLPFPVSAGDDGFRHELDPRFGRCVFGARARRHGRGAANASRGPRFRLSANQRPDHRQRGSVYRDRSREPRGAICAVLRSPGRVCPAAARLRGQPGHYVQFRHLDRTGFPAVGLGRQSHRVGFARGIRQQR
jgi:hypothetical protein